MPNGNAVANITVATSESWKDQQGQQQERTEWHRVVMFGKLAEIAGEYLRKGSQVYLEGKLQTRKWKDQSGQDKYTTEVVVDMGGTMQMLGGRNQNQGGMSQGGNQGGMNQGQGGYGGGQAQSQSLNTMRHSSPAAISPSLLSSHNSHNSSTTRRSSKAMVSSRTQVMRPSHSSQRRNNRRLRNSGRHHSLSHNSRTTRRIWMTAGMMISRSDIGTCA